MSTPEAAKGTSVDAPKKFSLEVLTVVKSAQIQYGLRHSDYQRYRHYCSRKLARIRKSLQFTHGEKRYNPRIIHADTVKNSDFLLIVLFKAERAWSYAMQLKQDMEIQTKNTRLRHHLVRRLEKASKWAALLETLCTATADERSALEAEAYAAWMAGLTALEKEQWELALDSFVKSSAIYDQIGSVAEYDLKDMYKQRVEEIDPSIRYCNYNLNKEKGVTKGDKAKKGGDPDDTRALVEMRLKGNELLSTKLDSVLNEARKKHTDDVTEITWKGRPLPVKNEKLQVLLISANEALTELEKATDDDVSKMPLYDKLYAAYADAMSVIKEDVAAVKKANQGKAKTGKVDAQEQNLLYLQDYVSYWKLSTTIQRSVSIAESAASGDKKAATAAAAPGGKKKHLRPDDIVRLYDGIMSNVNELRDMLGEENAEKARELSAQLLVFKAYRCYWLALSFATAGKAQESVALFDRASSHSSSARKQLEGTKPVNAKEISRLDKLNKLIKGSRSKSHAKAFLAHVQAQEEATKGISDLSLTNGATPTLAQNLNNYDTSFLAEKRIADLPPDYEPIPVRPLLFDMAFESCEFPDLEARKKPQKTGGFFSSLWGR